MDDHNNQNTFEPLTPITPPPKPSPSTTSLDISDMKKDDSPFSEEQEARIKELIGEAFEVVGKALKIHMPQGPSTIQDALDISRTSIMGEKDPYMTLDPTFHQSSVPQEKIEHEMNTQASQAMKMEANQPAPSQPDQHPDR